MDNNDTWMTLVMLALARAAQAQQFWGFSNGGSGSSPSSDDGSGSGSTSGSGSGSGSAPASGPGAGDFVSGVGGLGATFDPERATRIRAIHGILAAAAMVALFPSGAILAVCVLIAAVGLGIHLVQDVRNGTGMDLMSDSSVNSHFIIGLVVTACLILQPVFGIIHHEKYKRLRRRTIASYVHLFNGRICITLGIVNGGLGLWLAGASDKIKIAYIATAAALWTLWLLTAIWGEWQIWNATPRPWRRSKLRSSPSWTHQLGETSF
ncbi:hypothetical protein VTH06DRAFT_7217 [Thermothelomyces fergusii]